jgi:hypothetical protein
MMDFDDSFCHDSSTTDGALRSITEAGHFASPGTSLKDLSPPVCESEIERRARVDFAFGPYASAMPFDDAPDRG